MVLTCLLPQYGSITSYSRLIESGTDTLTTAVRVNYVPSRQIESGADMLTTYRGMGHLRTYDRQIDADYRGTGQLLSIS